MNFEAALRKERHAQWRYSRGWCPEPDRSDPPIGSVDAGHRAVCGRCGKRVSVTVRGRYAHHKVPRSTPTKEKP